MTDVKLVTSSPWVGRQASRQRESYPAVSGNDAGCVVTRADADSLELHFDAPQWAVTPGQSAVLYHGEASLGGGVIASTAVPTLQTETVT